MELVILIGLQASGKSTFYSRRLAQPHALVSKDLLRNNRKPSRRQGQLIREFLKGKKSVVVDNTNVTVEDRKDLIVMGRDTGATIIGYFFESKLQECLERNQRREGKLRVPDVGLFATAAKLVAPSKGEGFDELYFVRMDGQGGFSIEAWTEVISR